MEEKRPAINDATGTPYGDQDSQEQINKNYPYPDSWEPQDAVGWVSCRCV